MPGHDHTAVSMISVWPHWTQNGSSARQIRLKACCIKAQPARNLWNSAQARRDVFCDGTGGSGQPLATLYLGWGERASLQKTSEPRRNVEQTRMGHCRVVLQQQARKLCHLRELEYEIIFTEEPTPTAIFSGPAGLSHFLREDGRVFVVQQRLESGRTRKRLTVIGMAASSVVVDDVTIFNHPEHWISSA